MVLRITIDIFSGRPNPVVELRGAQAARALRQLRPTRPLQRDEAGLPPEPTLGYRGLIVEQVEERDTKLPRQFRVANGEVFGPRLRHKIEDESFEESFCGSAGPLAKLELGRGATASLRREIERFRKLRDKYKGKDLVWPLRPVCPCAPLYEPAWWNDGAQREHHNNCYNYGLNYRTDRFRLVPGGSQPGAAAGAMYGSLTCTAVKNGALADGVLDAPGNDNKCPGEGHLVALVVAPGIDFHWYRKGRNGRWTHKPGSTPVTNLDNSGKVITDPRTADRGFYTDFCSFMIVMHGHVKIQ